MIRDEWSRILRADPCAYCGGSGGTVDHVVPQSAGGEDEWLNLTGCCRACNSSKGVSSVLSWLARDRQPSHAKMTISFPPDLLQRLDARRGLVPRSTWLAEAVRIALEIAEAS